MVSAEQAIDFINGLFGAHPGFRALHAKGRFYSGTFTATPDASALCRAAHLQGEPVRVYVRWSNGSGHPRARDGEPDVRGMAVSFRLPGGSTSIAAQTAPYFPVKSPRAFLELTRASVNATRKPWQMARFLARHPRAGHRLNLNLLQGSVTPPSSFAVKRYFAIHAFKWTNAEGESCWVRYTLEPLEPAKLDKGTGRDRLFDEMDRRLAAGPVRFTLKVQIAGEGDDPDDPTAQWSSTRFIDAGTLEVTAPDPERETGGELVVFDPTKVTDGIELSNDPILLFRRDAYTVSAARRAH